jgi:FkbM family methyltransferase
VFSELQRHFGNHGNVELHNVAAGDREGTTTFHVTRDTTGASVLPPSDDMRALVGSNWTVESEIEVPMRTLDALLSDVAEVSLLKIDVQGFEKSVLAGARETLARTNFLLVELNYMPQYVGGSWFGELHELLTNEHPFVLVDASKPLRLNGRASMSDGLYVNIARLPDFAPREFV